MFNRKLSFTVYDLVPQVNWHHMTWRAISTRPWVKEKMKAPVYVYYELDNFYQNHRRYVKSRSDDQLSAGP
jgi:hypothetical protein